MEIDCLNLLDIGFCTKPHGIKGGFVFVLSNVQDSALEYVKTIYLFPRDSSSSLKQSGETFKITKISFGNKVIAYLQGVVDRNTVESMIPFDIKIDRASLKDLDSCELYVFDLIGWDVFEYGSGRLIGKVINSYDNGAQTVFVVQGKAQSFDIPFVESFVPVVDKDKRLLHVVIPEYVNEKG